MMINAYPIPINIRKTCCVLDLHKGFI
jgi:hypothetical protein